MQASDSCIQHQMLTRRDVRVQPQSKPPLLTAPKVRHHYHMGGSLQGGGKVAVGDECSWIRWIHCPQMPAWQRLISLWEIQARKRNQWILRPRSAAAGSTHPCSQQSKRDSSLGTSSRSGLTLSCSNAQISLLPPYRAPPPPTAHVVPVYCGTSLILHGSQGGFPAWMHEMLPWIFSCALQSDP